MRRLRREARLSQAELGAKTEVSRHRLSRLERDLSTPTSEEVTRLAAALGLSWSDLVRGTDWLTPADRRAIRRASRHVSRTLRRPTHYRPARDRETGIRLDEARSLWPETYGRLDEAILARPDGRTAWRFMRCIPSDSAVEALFWMTLLAAGAEPLFLAPEEMGFRALPVVDPRTGTVAGVDPVPALRLVLEGLVVLLFPQVPVHPLRRAAASRRLDALVAVDRRGGLWWCNLEIDGPGHDPRGDAERAREIGLPVVRLQGEQVLGKSLLAHLGSLLRSCPERAAA